MSALIRVIWQRTRANLTFSHIERSDGSHTHNDATKHTVPCTGRVARALGERTMQIHEHGEKLGLSEDKLTKLDAALDRVKKLRRREPSPLPPQRPLPLLSAICTARVPSAWNSPLAALHLHEVRIILIHAYLASSWPITPNKSSGLRVIMKT